MNALLDAALELGAGLELDRLLDRVVASAAEVAGARYAALGIFAPGGAISRFVQHGMDDETVRRIGAFPRGEGLLGEVLVSDEPIRLDDVRADPRFRGFPPRHPQMRTFLGVPIARGRRRYGSLCLAEKVGAAAFDDEDEALVVMLAAFAAGALENARLAESERFRVQALADLAAAEERERTRREMLGFVIVAQEAERARVARDLHDGVGQALTSVLLGIRLVEAALEGDEPDLRDAAKRVGELRTLAADALRDARRLAFELRPTVLDDVGLGPALARLVEDVRGAQELRIDLEAPDLLGDRRLPAQVETVVYRVVQEGLTNAVRHAAATRVQVSVAVDVDLVRALVVDDGIGFADHGARDGLGLRGMIERAELVEGRLEISSAIGAGTTITLEVPLG